MFPQRYNRTNFVTNAVAVKILAAMEGALADGLQHYVENKRGQRWLRVCIRPIEGSDNRFSFEFHAGNGQEVGHLILQALFVWSSDNERHFSTLLGKLYVLRQHPYTLKLLSDAQAERDAADKERRDWLKARGVTHSFKAPGGITYLGRWTRNWLGRKQFLAIADAQMREFYKPFKLDNESLWYGSVQGAYA
ncbi:hypothetical protein HOS76_gp19 [Pseudomonas phage Henninger]|uniref:Uncharacterized protein n=1 Tax=Pseudomonas phage Henninger TaxID=2079287 RepID=A0A2K9VH92_9CAUD|nr:hypothetical protein HOS76_gp19 [Pseudomonas phage Henninger]AUV61713.1 hypothetical protein PsPhHenninger_gp34 [Pseudomonas phage Henninger]